MSYSLRKSSYLGLLLAVFFLAFSNINASAENPHGVADKHGPAWGYIGGSGPDRWGELSPLYADCGLGMDQSPIDIPNIDFALLPAIKLKYFTSRALKLKNLGHTIRVDYKDHGTLEFDGTKFYASEYHFHTPSEHFIAGKQYPMEIHVVNRDDSGRIAVVSILVNMGEKNPNLENIIEFLPRRVGSDLVRGVKAGANMFLPDFRGYYTYMGSFTTPPCKENVKWIILKQPIEMSKGQIDAFSELMRKNNRPLQPLNERKVSASID